MTDKPRPDLKDRKIISILSRGSQVSQEAIAREISLRQPSVAVRIKKLRDGGFLDSITGINPFRVGLQMAKVDIKTTDPQKVLSMFANCPYFYNGMIISGRNNLCLLFVAGNISTLESIMDNHLRKMAVVQDVDFNIVISPSRPLVMPVQFDRKKTDASCDGHGACRNCAERISGRCAACPVQDRSGEWFF